MADAASYLQYSFIVPAALTVAGWYIVAHQADRREFRKEVREQLKDLKTSTDLVLAAAAAYWLAEDIDKSASTSTVLSSEIKRLGRHMRNIESVGLKVNATSRLVDIRTIATGGDFQVRGRKHNDEDVERVRDLAGILEDLLSELDKAFYAAFHPARSSWNWRQIAVFGLLLLLIRDQL